MTEPTEPTLLDLRAALAGTYEIEAPLGRGGMSLVYLARERRLDRRVAIKVLSPELAVDDAYRRLFLHEARTVAALTHPNIVPIHAVGEVGDFVFFAMAYVEGDTLAQRIATVGPLNPHRAARLLCDIGDALGFAHARGVVHRDVKPDNILIDAATGRALLTDFGIAHASPATVARLGRPAAPRGRVVGTAAFISPEQARGDAVDARSDLYSLGVVAFYVLSGQLPFNAVTDAEFLVQHIAEPAPSLATVVPLVPPRVAQIVDRCLSKEAWARFADAASLVRALADAVEPPPVPLAVRAFLVRSAHLDGPALIHGFITGAMLLPATIAAWLSATTMTVRGLATAALVAALIVPVGVAVSRARRLLLAGQNRGELVAALAARQARRREELVFAYGPRAVGLERAIVWLARVSILVAGAAVAGMIDAITLPPDVEALMPAIAVVGGVTALLAATVARARTEQRTDPRGERRLRFWRGALGRWVFRIAGVGLTQSAPIVTILGSSETPA